MNNNENPCNNCICILLLGSCPLCSLICGKGYAVCDAGICVVEFNASFNAQNAVPWIEELNDCATGRVDIASAPTCKGTPDSGGPNNRCVQRRRGSQRVQANIMMTMEATKDDVQDAIDEIIVGDF